MTNSKTPQWDLVRFLENQLACLADALDCVRATSIWISQRMMIYGADQQARNLANAQHKLLASHQALQHLHKQAITNARNHVARYQNSTHRSD